MRKRINKSTIIFGSIVSLIILLVESLVQLKFSFIFTIAYVLGLFTGLLNLMFSDLGLSRLEFSQVSKPKVFYTLLHILKFIIYGIVLYSVAYFLGYLTTFTCAFGMLFHKIIIYYLFLRKDKMDDKNRLIEKLKISDEIKQKLKENNYYKTSDLTETNRETLLKFLTNIEIDQIIKSLKEYELFIKGELEAIIEDDENLDI